MKKRISLNHLKIESFVTSVSRKNIFAGYNQTHIGPCEDSNYLCKTQSDCSQVTQDDEYCFPE